MQPSTKAAALLVAAAFVSSSASGSAILGSYDMDAFTGTNPNVAFQSADADANSVAGDITPGAALAALTGGGAPRFGRSTIGGNPLPGAFSRSPESYADSFFTFTVTPLPGFGVTYSQIALDLRVSSTGNAGDFTGSIFIAESVGGFPVSQPVATAAVLAANNTDSPWQTVTLPLAISSDGPVEFRVYVWDDNAADGAVMRFDNVVLTGDVAPVVPEPSMMGVAAMAAAAMLRRRRAR